MNRFFSKLDPRDIKIDPQGSRFPPDEEAYEDEPQAEASVVTESSRVPYAPAWAEPAVAAIVAADPAPAAAVAPAIELNGAAAAAPIEERYDGEVARYGEVLKVSARSRPSAVAGAIAGVVRENGRAEVQAIGAGATNQAVKAVAIARDYLRETGIEAICLPAFIDVTIDNEDRTAIRLVVEPR
jgi:stage V sporulation protein S